jgi:hypothetical protein
LIFATQHGLAATVAAKPLAAFLTSANKLLSAVIA